jgi:transcription initiation factor TFIID subunit 11
MSLVSGSAAGASKKRKRKSKGTAANDDASVAGGKAKSTEGKGKRRASRDQTAEEEDEGPDGEEMAVEMVARTQEERQKEIEHRAMLVRSFDENQFARYEAWRSSKLSDSVVRRVSLF